METIEKEEDDPFKKDRRNNQMGQGWSAAATGIVEKCC